MIAPLDWGLGHATRCIPIIREFRKRDCTVMIATSGGALQLLKIEFPELAFFEIASYRAKYATNNRLLIKLFFQSFKFISAIRKEHAQLRQILKDNNIDLIVSDNRFGCYSMEVKSIFVTHQINFILQTPFKWASKLFSSWNQQQIKKFDTCWIPDFPNQEYTGKLSSPHELSISYVGVLSRFQKSTCAIEKKYDVVALISGPEPQRTIFEESIRKQVEGLALKVLLVKGKPEEGGSISNRGNVSEVGHLRELELQHAIEESEFVLCRSGYSSIMDLAVLERKNIIMVPTPGQPEQEYLAALLDSKGRAFTVAQENFDLIQAMKKAIDYLGFTSGVFNNDLLKAAIDEALLDIKWK